MKSASQIQTHKPKYRDSIGSSGSILINVIVPERGGLHFNIRIPAGRKLKFFLLFLKKITKLH